MQPGWKGARALFQLPEPQRKCLLLSGSGELHYQGKEICSRAGKLLPGITAGKVKMHSQCVINADGSAEIRSVP